MLPDTLKTVNSAVTVVEFLSESGKIQCTYPTRTDFGKILFKNQGMDFSSRDCIFIMFLKNLACKVTKLQIIYEK